MKLRNKKTGKVIDGFITTIQWNNKLRLSHLGGQPFKDYKSLTEFNENWEDYKPKEPLIKDEKIRKAVRAWAEALKENTLRFDLISQGFSFGDGNVYSSINFDGFVFDLVDGKKYTIAELCGEKEE